MPVIARTGATVQFGVVEPIQQVNAARTRRSQADAQPAREPWRTRTGHDDRCRSSWRTWTKRIWSWCELRSASMMPLIPSPGRPKISVSTPQSMRRSYENVVVDMALLGLPLQCVLWVSVRGAVADSGAASGKQATCMFGVSNQIIAAPYWAGSCLARRERSPAAGWVAIKKRDGVTWVCVR